MGRTALRRVIDHPDLELVGVYVYDSRKVGVDAGEIARRPPTGVRATHRIEDILALRPDVVLHMSRITLPYEKQNADVVRCCAGIDVISTAVSTIRRVMDLPMPVRCSKLASAARARWPASA